MASLYWPAKTRRAEGSTGGCSNLRRRSRHGKFYLDRLPILYEYDVIDHRADRFSPPASYLGSSRFIASLQHTNSWADANQCLQLCDLLTGCIYQELVPSQNRFKLAAS